MLHFVSTLDTLGSKWFIYMTNQGIGLLTLHYLVYAGPVSYPPLNAKRWESTLNYFNNQSSLPFFTN